MKQIIGVLSVILLLSACGDSPASVEDEALERQSLEQVVDRDGPISFVGRTTFGAYFSRTSEWFLNPEHVWCPVEAEMSFGAGHEVVLATTENGPCMGRQIEWHGEVTPGGAVKLNMPEGVAAEVALHTGCTLSGTFPVYHGTFDGDDLAAAGHFHGHCDGGTVWGPYFGFPDDPGPVHVVFGFELMRD